MLHVSSIKYIKDYCVWVSFDDGSSGNVNLFNHLKGTMFEHLKNKDLFKQAFLDEELETIVWPNGADFAPEFLKENLE